jgi:hypothetical protein
MTASRSPRSSQARLMRDPRAGVCMDLEDPERGEDDGARRERALPGRYEAFSAARPAMAASAAMAVRSPTEDTSMHQATGYSPLGLESTRR